MRLNTLEKLYLCLRDLTPEVDVPEAIREAALVPLRRMLEISAANTETETGTEVESELASNRGSAVL